MRKLLPVRKRTALLVSVFLVVLLVAATAFADVTGQPALSVTSPVSDSVVSVWNPAIVVAASDPAGLEGAGTIVVDGASYAVGVAFAESGGHWEDDGCESWWQPDYDYTRGTLSFTPAKLSDGTHTATLTLRNRLGSSNTVAWSFSVQAPPTYAGLTPADGSAVKGSQPTLSASLNDNGTVATVSVTLDGARIASTWNPTTRVVSAPTPSPLADGTHVVSVAATDSSGLGSSMTWHFSTLNTAAIAFSAPLPSAGTTTTAWNPRISLACSDSALLTAATMQIDGVAVPAAFQPAADRHSAAVSYQTASLGDGQHTAKVTATDNLGFSASYTWTFGVAAPPRFSAPSPANNGWATTLTPTVSVVVAENGSVASSSVSVDGVRIPATYDAATKVLRGVPAAPLSDETTHLASVTATDAAGWSATYAWSFKTRATVPAFSAATPAPASAVSGYRPALAVSMADTIGLAAAPTMRLDGVKVPATFGFLESGGYWDGDEWDDWWVPEYDHTRGTIRYQPPADLANGTHTVTVDATNSIGGSSTYVWAFTVAAAPQLSAPSPTDGAWVTTLTPTVSVKVKANTPVAAVAVTIDGMPASAVYDDVGKVVRGVPLAPLADESPHTVSIAVTDSAGLGASYAWGFRTDATPPAVGARSPAAGATIAVAGSQITVAATDPSGMAANPVMTLDGVAVPCWWGYVETGGYWDGDEWDEWWVASYDYTGGTARFSAANLKDGPHTVTARLTNAAGLATTSTWTFDVAAPPVLSAPSPANGAWAATLTPAITAKVAENSTVTATSVFVDGLPVASVYDPVSKTVRAQPVVPLLDDVSHTVVVTVTDGVGATGSLNWSFKTHSTPPVVASAVPATSTAVWDPAIAVGFSDLSGLDGSAVMTLDGAVVPASFGFRLVSEEWVGEGCDSYLEQIFDYTQGTVSYRPAKLSDGLHTASVRVRDNAGITRTHAWTFDVQAPPKLSDAKPTAGSRVATQQPSISLAVTENSTVATVSAMVDGGVVPAVYDAAARRVNVLPGHLLANDLAHKVVVNVADASGNGAEISWSFRVQTFADMPGTGAPDCTSCHTTYPASHPMADCDACHGWGGPVEDCRSCHGYGGHGPYEFDAADWGGPYGCTRCHQPGYASVPVHPATDDFHDTSRDMTSCRPCHVASLSIEHFRYSDASGAALTCAACHQSADTDVRAAISAGDTDCGACHDIGSGSHLEQHADAALSAECLTCHMPNVVSEHLSNARTQSTTLTCDSCHASTDESVRTAIAAGSTACAACHSQAHGDLTPIHVPADVGSLSCGGAGCHDGGDTLAIHAGRAEGACAVCHANPARGDLTAGKVTAACGGCHATAEVDYHRNMAVHITAPSTYETCGGCHHFWGSSPVSGHNVTLHTGGCRTCHNGVIDTASLTTDCGECHKVEGADYHTQTAVTHSPADSGSLECARCHATTNVRVLHAEVGCDVCHVTRSCFECHSVHNGQPGSPLLSGVSCSRCHTAVGTDYHKSFEATHTFSAMDPACQSSGCHSADLVTTHGSFVGAGSTNPQYADTCALCHLNDDPARVPEGATADCSSCHTMHGDMATIHGARGLPTTVQLFNGLHEATGPSSIQVDCALCHDVANIAVIHGNDCSTCHPTPRDSFTTWTGSCQQAGCHVTYHANADAGHRSSIAGCACHGPDFEVQASYCGHCHTIVDHQAPMTTSDAKAAYTGPVTVRLSPTDSPAPGGSGIAHTYWVLDGGAVAEGRTVPVPQPASGSVTHSLAFWSVDGAGNVEATHTVGMTVTKDALAPTTTSDARATYAGRATIRLTTTDNGSAAPVTCYSLDGGATTTGTVITVAQPASGSATHTLDFWAVDGAGNTEIRRSATFVVSVDDVAPATTTNLAPAYRAGTTTLVTMTATDGGFGVASTHYRLNGGAPVARAFLWIDYTVPAGINTLEYWSVDGGGNVEAHHTATFTVDGTAPITTSDAVASYPGPAHVHFNAGDGAAGSGVASTYVRVDGAPATAATETTVYTPGTHSIEFWSVDRVGIAEVHHTVTLTITSAETPPPTTTSDAAPSYIGSATVTLTASDEGGSGVAATYWRLNGGTRTTGTSINVNAPGTYSLEFWSVDNAGNEETPHHTVTFSVAFPPNTGLVTFLWVDPPPGNWTYYYVYVYDSSQRLIATAYNETGRYDVYLPVSPQPYTLRAYWYAPDDPGYPVWSYGSALIDSPGKTVEWRF